MQFEDCFWFSLLLLFIMHLNCVFICPVASYCNISTFLSIWGYTRPFIRWGFWFLYTIYYCYLCICSFLWLSLPEISITSYLSLLREQRTSIKGSAVDQCFSVLDITQSSIHVFHAFFSQTWRFLICTGVQTYNMARIISFHQKFIVIWTLVALCVHHG